MRKAFFQVDVFTDRPLLGNPAAVVFDADDLPGDILQRIAREMNLSETVFILAPDTPEADYRARIFSPVRELPFGGHPTLAAASAVLANQPAFAGATRLRQSCGIGIVPIEVVTEDKARWYWMTQAEPEFREAPVQPSILAELLGCRPADLAETIPAVVSTGVPWWIVELRSVEALASVRVDLPRLEALAREFGAAGITAFAEHPAGGPHRLRVRTFAPGDGIAEDPVCGSGNGCVAAFVARYKHDGEAAGAYRAEQGVEIGRNGEVRAAWTRTDGRLQIRIGGQTATVATGTLHL